MASEFEFEGTDGMGATENRDSRYKILLTLRAVNSGVMRLMTKLINPLGLSPTQGQLLGELHKRGGRGTVGELACGLGTPCSNVSNICNRLSASGLVSKSRAATDSRSVEITLTETGEQKLEGFFAQFSAIEKSISDRFSPEQLEALVQSLQLLESSVQAELASKAE